MRKNKEKFEKLIEKACNLYSETKIKNNKKNEKNTKYCKVQSTPTLI